MKKLIAITICAAALAGFGGCNESTYLGDIKPNIPPTIKLTSGPLEGDTTSYQIKFSWVGNDRDGRVDRYECVVCEGDPLGFDPADTTGLDKWSATDATDSVFKFRADEYEKNIVVQGSKFSQYGRTQTLFVRAVDNRGGRSDPAYRSFTSRTLAPYVIIDTPRNPHPGQSQLVPPMVRFTWRALDPIDTPWNTQKADSVRYLLIPSTRNTLEELNESPGDFEDLWSPWRWVDAPGDSGTSTVVGDDELMDRQRTYMFVLQAKDEAGAVTTIFDPRSNLREFAIFYGAGPLLKVSEPYLGSFSYIGINNRPETFKVPGGFVFRFTWKADASSYGGEVSSYRYGWDLSDLNDPGQWAVDPSPFVTGIPATSFKAGVHTLYIEAVDNNGISTIAQMEISVFPLDMSRNLLWIDDFYSTDFYQRTYAFPTETEHTTFWLRLCGRASGFSPTRDVYVTAMNSYQYPDIELLWKYRNIIWSYSSEDRINAWDDMVRFTPESRITSSTVLSFNTLAYFIASGGHVWSEGKGDRQGGLGAVLAANAQAFPLNLRCEITGQRVGCDGDTSGVHSMAYQEYCVTVLDKVSATPRNDSRMPTRREDWDGMSYGYRDPRDLITVAHPGLPPRLTLWDVVTRPGNFFDPMSQGFTYVELYNPGYWMSRTGVKTQPCFHPMYRMRARSTYSSVDDATIAFWTTKYADVIANVPGAVAAPSVQMGVPLWFFNRAQADSISDVIFKEWGISAR